jgi:predicted dehydrogenase
MGRWHAWAAERAGGLAPAVADIDRAAASRLAARHKGARAFSDVEEMLRATRLDVLHVCSPPDTHYRITELGIDTGLSVIIEKPLTPRAAEAEILFDRAESRGVMICPVHQFLFQDGALHAKASLPRIGRMVHLQSAFCSAGGAGQGDEQLDVIAADILPHPLSLMQAFLPTGLPESGWEITRPCGGELRVSGEASGISLSILVSMRARPTLCSFQIFGADGTIHMDMFHGYAVVEPGKVSRLRKMIHPFDLAIRTLSAAATNLGLRTIKWQPAYPGLERLVKAFYQAARSGAEPPITRADVMAVARVRDLLTQ